MGVGPNFVLDKSFNCEGSTAYAFGEAIGFGSAATKCVRQTSAGGVVIGICQENIDATKVTTTKANVDVRILGMTRAIAGAAVSVGDHLKVDGSARLITSAQKAAGVQPTPVCGVAFTAATTAGQYIDVLLTPFDVY